MKKLLTLLLLSAMSLSTMASYALPVHHHHKHLKKNGHPDRRYKANRAHLKKNGKPDRRFKASQVK